jgi:hypothetical protein
MYGAFNGNIYLDVSIIIKWLLWPFLWRYVMPVPTNVSELGRTVTEAVGHDAKALWLVRPNVKWLLAW